MRPPFSYIWVVSTFFQFTHIYICQILCLVVVVIVVQGSVTLEQLKVSL